MTRTTLALVLAGLMASAAQADQARQAAKDNAAFALELYQQIKDQPGNLFYSPYSISTALAMTYAGARDRTAKQMEQVLRFSLGQQKLHPAMAALMSDLNGRKIRERWSKEDGQPAFRLVTANALWGQQGYRFRKEFLELTRQRYGAGLTELDFKQQTEASRTMINDWVARQTQQKIKNLIPRGQLTPGVRLVLTNAIYFKAAWEQPFNERATKQQPFHLTPAKQVEAPIMHRAEHFRYLDAGEHHLVALPYRGRELEMLLLVPKAIDGLPALERKLTRDALEGWYQRAGHARRILLGLPRFKATSRFELSQALQKLGMTDAFAFGKADFSGMADTRELYIGFVIHKAFVAVDEKGTEAAAATAVGMKAGGMPQEPVPLQIDRPFLFLLRDRKTGSLLFVGRIVDPR